jgi:CheY-like chemotaxis protein
LQTTTTRTILCVDDDSDDRDLVCNVIQKLDPSIVFIHAENGLVAHKILSQAKLKNEFPCLIILDINMPLMDGKQTLVRIKKDPDLTKIPIVMFSTSSSALDKAFCSQYGVELVTKPAKLATVYSEVEKLLSHCR